MLDRVRRLLPSPKQVVQVDQTAFGVTGPP